MHAFITFGLPVIVLPMLVSWSVGYVTGRRYRLWVVALLAPAGVGRACLL
ncbi:MAG TPA: hypothetical protein VHC67_14785 [Gaiellaceae bacterium]|jgi:hypothetical protein|nr:hypothetical protein [Gaiellaceae bacterium]